MSWLLDRLLRSARTWTLPLALAMFFLAVPATTLRAQIFGYGGYGYGYPGFGYGYPGFGYGYPGFGYGYGFGYPGFGYGGYGFGYGGPGVTIAGPYAPYGYPYGYGGYGPGALNPLFGLGLTPLGVNSALTERYLLGRGTAGYSSSYGAVPNPGAVSGGIGTGTVTTPLPGTRVNPR